MKLDLLKLTNSYCKSLKLLCQTDIDYVKFGQHLNMTRDMTHFVLYYNQKHLVILYPYKESM